MEQFAENTITPVENKKCYVTMG
jgi:hypothetical protein